MKKAGLIILLVSLIVISGCITLVSDKTEAEVQQEVEEAFFELIFEENPEPLNQTIYENFIEPIPETIALALEQAKQPGAYPVLLTKVLYEEARAYPIVVLNGENVADVELVFEPEPSANPYQNEVTIEVIGGNPDTYSANEERIVYVIATPTLSQEYLDQQEGFLDNNFFVTPNEDFLRCQQLQGGQFCANGMAGKTINATLFGENFLINEGQQKTIKGSKVTFVEVGKQGLPQIRVQVPKAREDLIDFQGFDLVMLADGEEISRTPFRFEINPDTSEDEGEPIP